MWVSVTVLRVFNLDTEGNRSNRLERLDEDKNLCFVHKIEIRQINSRHYSDSTIPAGRERGTADVLYVDTEPELRLQRNTAIKENS